MMFCMKISSLLIIQFLVPLALSAAQVPDFETTRMKSTAGAGVGSMLMDEASFLNPAPIAFYEISSIYVSRATMEQSDLPPEGDNTDPNEKINSRGKAYAFIASDAKGPLKGSLAHQRIRENGIDSSRWSAALASPIGPQSSLGFWGRRVSESHQKPIYMMAIGAFHVIDPALSFGLVFVDPIKSSPKARDSKIQLGGQYVFKELISFILDVGGNPYKNIEEKHFIKGAVQLKIFGDLYFRAGLFKDQTVNENGSGIGGGWLTPKLNIEGALKSVNSTPKLQRRKDISFSLSYRF